MAKFTLLNQLNENVEFHNWEIDQLTQMGFDPETVITLNQLNEMGDESATTAKKDEREWLADLYRQKDALRDAGKQQRKKSPMVATRDKQQPPSFTGKRGDTPSSPNVDDRVVLPGGSLGQVVKSMRDQVTVKLKDGRTVSLSPSIFTDPRTVKSGDQVVRAWAIKK